MFNPQQPTPQNAAIELPEFPVIYVVQVTRGAVVVYGKDAYACTNALDIIATIADLLPADGTLNPIQRQGQPAQPTTSQSAPDPADPTDPDTLLAENNLLAEQQNLLVLSQRWHAGLITDEQFDQYINELCPDISLEEAYMTRDSFGPQQDADESTPIDIMPLLDREERFNAPS